MNDSNSGQVSSPVATGNAGGEFEKHVDAAFLALLLVRGIPPILTDCAVVEVHLQTEHLGWNTDDVLVIGESGVGNRRKLIGQVKRTFTISATNPECIKTITDSWKDFLDKQKFSEADDRFAIITLRGTNTFLAHFAGLLDCARTSRDVADFEHRLTTPGFVHATVVRYLDAIQKIVEEYEGRKITWSELWPFLKVLHALSFDLNSSTKQTESHIKTLLAHTTDEQDAIGVADRSWSELLREVGVGMQRAKSYCRDNLPEMLRELHSPVSDTQQHALQSLRDHSALILEGIRTTLGLDLHLTRNKLVQNLLAKLELTPIVVVAGPAGSGKSGIAKEAIIELSKDNFTFCFRAGEFAVPHFDETLQRGQIPVNGTTLGAILAGQNQKVLLVESIERLLEASIRDAFTDLLSLLKKDFSWRLVLTCRDYSLALVLSSMLEYASLGYSLLRVPPLDDYDLIEVEKASPELSLPLSNQGLRRLLRNPYMLDKAIQMPWPDDRPLPENERAFRAKFWKDIIHVTDNAANSMPRRRQYTFIEIALRRARELSSYVSSHDLDLDAVETLRQDSLLSYSEMSNEFVAPVHDVLEDWAILHWIEEQFAIHEDSLSDFSEVLGTFPAIRRTYRKWISELVERDVDSANRIFVAVVHDQALSAQFRDDTLVSLLQSQDSPNFLQRQVNAFFSNDRSLLRRIIHLLRVGCVTTPSWLDDTGGVPSLTHVPDGPAWEYMFGLVASQLDEFDESDRLLLLGFIEDGMGGVHGQSPYPAGAESIITIAYWLLPLFEDYKSKKELKRTLKVIAQLPNCDPKRFTQLMKGDQTNDNMDHLSEQFRKIVLWSMEGMPACRDFPEIVIDTLRNEMMLIEEDLQDVWSLGSSRDIYARFGIKDRISSQCFPPSAYHGPFIHLFRYHPQRTISFLIELFNHSVECYRSKRVPMYVLEPLIEISLTFVDNSTRNQWGNGRLWNLFRGTSVGPYALKSALMAFENWLLEFGVSKPNELDELLLAVLRQSRSAALTGVVASVATAFPQKTAETLLVFLRSPECILLDRGRLSSELQASALSGMLPVIDAMERIFEEERKQANALPHRQQDLESAIANLQLGPNAQGVNEIIDKHLEEIPPVEKRTQDDRIWLLALHRMDLRRYIPTEDSIEDMKSPEESKLTETGERQQILFNLNVAEPDVLQMVNDSATRCELMNDHIGLLMWGINVFGHEGISTYDPAQWRERLTHAQDVTSTNEEGSWMSEYGGPTFVAAVCIRDHYKELSPGEVGWCVETICTAVERNANNWNHNARIQIGGIEGDRPAAWVLPSLVGKGLDDCTKQRVLATLALTVTHPIDEVRSYAAAGIGQHLWAIDREQAMRCINGLATEAMMVQQQLAAESTLPFDGRIDQIEREAATLVRSQFYNEMASDAYENLDLADWTGSKANTHILTILVHEPEESLSMEAFRRLANILVQWWDSDDNNHGHRKCERSHEIELVLTKLLEKFCLRIYRQGAALILQPILDAIDRHPGKVSWILQGIISAEDCLQRTEQFWAVWGLFAQRIRTASWLARIDSEYPRGSELMAAVFLTQYWRDDVRHWRSLEGHSHCVHELFESLPPSVAILDDYVRFLYHIGEQSLPSSFERISNRLKAGDTKNMLQKGNTVFMLEALLRRYVYGQPLELKRSRGLRESVLYLLDTLVENGSSASYRMRDDFVTPINI